MNEPQNDQDKKDDKRAKGNRAEKQPAEETLGLLRDVVKTLRKLDADVKEIEGVQTED